MITDYAIDGANFFLMGMKIKNRNKNYGADA